MMLRFYGHRNRIYNFNAMATECDRYNTSTRRRNAFRKKRLADELLTTSTLAYSLFNIHVTFFASRPHAGAQASAARDCLIHAAYHGKATTGYGKDMT